MKSPKTMAVIAIAGLLALSPSLRAQTSTNNTTGRRGMRGMSVETQMTRLDEQLKLTDEQKPKVKAVLEDQNKKMQELFGDSSVSREDRRTKMQSIREDSNKKLKEILTSDQYKKYQDYEKERRNRRGGRRNNGGGGNTENGGNQ
ncbi:MAG TPA: hypothetical protein VFM25_00200 [Verrucomicrobiae bacterium]|nr:hypothetical protein [Verrucomicrobiae bacterium]